MFNREKKKDKRKWLALLILLILLLLLGTIVPLDKIPGARGALIMMGFDDIDNRGVTLVSILTGDSNLKMGIYGGGPAGGVYGPGGAAGGGGRYDPSRSDLYYTMSAVSPAQEGPLGATYLLDAQRLREAAITSGSSVPQVSYIASQPADGYTLPQDLAVDSSKFNAAQQGVLQGDVPLASNPSEGPPVTSSLIKPGGGDIIQSVNQPSGGGVAGANLSQAVRNLGAPARGQFKQMVNPTSNTRTGRAPLGELNDFGAQPLNQAGTSWVITGAGARAKIPESKKLLARGAFDGSIRPDDVVLQQNETAPAVSDQASINKDAAKFENDKRKTKQCQDAMTTFSGKLDDSRKQLLTISQQVIDKAPGCCSYFGAITMYDYQCHNDTNGWNQWNGLIDQLVAECKNYNQIQTQINYPCDLRSRRPANCDVLVDYKASNNADPAKFLDCSVLKQSGWTIRTIFGNANYPLRPQPDASPQQRNTFEVLRVLTEEALMESVFP